VHCYDCCSEDLLAVCLSPSTCHQQHHSCLPYPSSLTAATSRVNRTSTSTSTSSLLTPQLQTSLSIIGKESEGNESPIARSVTNLFISSPHHNHVRPVETSIATTHIPTYLHTSSLERELPIQNNTAYPTFHFHFHFHTCTYDFPQPQRKPSIP
jgi:hypothetical protein